MGLKNWRKRNRRANDKKPPWSKLQRDLYNLMLPEFQIHCVAYRMPKSWSRNPQIPRVWITVGKEIIWDIPADFVDVIDKNQIYIHIPAINQLIRDYINTPRDQVFSLDDEYGLYEILRKYDRRFQ